MFKGLIKLFSSDRNGSKDAAKNRLHFVLVQDRAGLSNEEMSSFKSELMLVVERYFDVDDQGFNIEYRRDGDMTTLVINSPVLTRRAKSRSVSNGARLATINGGVTDNGGVTEEASGRGENSHGEVADEVSMTQSEEAIETLPSEAASPNKESTDSADADTSSEEERPAIGNG